MSPDRLRELAATVPIDALEWTALLEATIPAFAATLPTDPKHLN